MMCKTTSTTTFINRRLKRFIDGVFEKADINNDGTINSQEAYDLVLFIYIQVNQQAPIPPPTRDEINDIIKSTDMDRNGRIQRDEFKNLVFTILSRASTRLVAYKFLSLLIAPILATLVSPIVFAYTPGKSWMREVSSQWIPEETIDKIFNETLCQTVLTVFLVSTLGNVVIEMASGCFNGSVQKEEKPNKQK